MAFTSSSTATLTCEDVMTRNPSACVPGDSAQTAAQLMKSRDVGPIPVVDDHLNQRLVGMITDRDLAINIVAAGQDPKTTRLDEIMSRDLITCSPGDPIDKAMDCMARYQVRRVPIVDTSGRLVGIIAQADIARQGDDRQVGDVVEGISQPQASIFGRTARRMGGGMRSASGMGRGDSTNWLIATGLGAGLAAAAMYYLGFRRSETAGYGDVSARDYGTTEYAARSSAVTGDYPATDVGVTDYGSRTGGF